MLGVACCMALGHHRRLKDVGGGMSVSLWTTHTDDRRRAWHVIIALGLLLPLDDMKRGTPTWSDDVGNYMPSSHLANTHGRTTSGMECHLALGQRT